ncbi:nuclear autoantigenic sperm protein [Clonorchis sinensis]|uniref:Nuclear autoantigenic sperm protein n=1 Tax=Clonorchis sinensis TaxID=79923 RepID=G7YXD3_CLOSI|nr:nuclear autoantigenic sperm protein [Clonorchis sinensis]
MPGGEPISFQGDEAADKANGDASTIEGAECAPEDEVEEKASSDEDSEEEVESASNNEEQAETAEDEVDADTQEDISNLQLAWEVLEVSKTIYSRKNDDESRLKVADCLEKLAEISREKEDYVQALSDLQDCLTIRSAVLNDDHRDIAEVHYQLGTTHAIAGALDLASTCFRNAVSCLQQHANNIRTKITEMEKLDDQAVELEALRNSFKEVESLVSDVQRRHAEVNEDLAATQLGIQSNSSTLAVKSTESDTNAQVVDDISHLVRKKRAVSDETAGEPTVSEIIPAPSETQKLKKARITADNPATNGDVGHLNGTSQATLTNGTQVAWQLDIGRELQLNKKFGQCSRMVLWCDDLFFKKCGILESPAKLRYFAVLYFTYHGLESCGCEAHADGWVTLVGLFNDRISYSRKMRNVDKFVARECLNTGVLETRIARSRLQWRACQTTSLGHVLPGSSTNDFSDGSFTHPVKSFVGSIEDKWQALFGHRVTTCPSPTAVTSMWRRVDYEYRAVFNLGSDRVYIYTRASSSCRS